LLRKL